jgi:hypothetical protein
MDLKDALKVQDNIDQVYIDKITLLLKNTIIAKALFNMHKGNDVWDIIDGKLGKEYFNPNFSLFSTTIQRKMDGYGIATSNWQSAIRKAVSKVNQDCDRKVFRVEPLRNSICVRWVN